MTAHTPSAPPVRPDRRLRPRELEDWLNHRIYHPLAWRLATLLARTPVTPNMVSVAGGLLVVAAGVAYSRPGWPLPALIGMLLHMGWHVVDGADGDLARITGRASPIGEIVDGICDYASHTVLYLILGWLLVPTLGGWAWPLVVAGGVSHAVQANHAEAWRRAYQWWIYGVPWLRQSQGHKAGGVAGRLAGVYMALAEATSAGIGAIDAAHARAPEAVRAGVREEAGALLGPLWLVGPNPRAIILGLSMLAGSPLWYFAWEIAGLNLLLLRSIRSHAALAARIVARAG